MSELPDLPGYEVLRAVRQDGLSVFYKARDRALGHSVELQLFPRGGGEGGNVLRHRLRRQWALEANLNHPHILPLGAVGEHDGIPYAVRPFFEGPRLDEKLTWEGPVAARDAARWVEQLAHAAHHVHERGFVHLNIEPDNILLAEGVAVLTGFDWARPLDEVKGWEAEVFGVPPYLSPEQVRGERVSQAADVYSLGALLYHLLTGRPPFQKASGVDRLVAIMEEAPLAPRQTNPNVPVDLEAVCLKCLAKGPADRYPSAQALADDLRRFLDGRPVASLPQKRRGWLRRWWGRA